MSEIAAPTLLQMRGIRKQYPGVLALDGVDFDLCAGEVHALIGENGAGKSTLMKILAGAEQADQGEVLLDGQPLQLASPLEGIRAGLSIIYQEFCLVPSMSVEENIFLGREPTTALGLIRWREMRRRAIELLQRLDAQVDAAALVETLSVAQQQMVEIAKAVSVEARVIAMDEPTAALTEHEIERLFALIAALKAQGVGIIYISHRLDEVETLADRVTVLRDGKWVSTDPRGALDRAEIIRRMVGRPLTQQFPVRASQPGEVALAVRGLSRRGVLHDITFEVRRGEVVALAGLVGAGRTEVARAIFGADPIDGGSLSIAGRPLRPRHPTDAVRAGVGLVTEDRKAQGLVLQMAVRENNTLANLGAVSRGGFIQFAQERRVAESFVASLDIRTPSVEQTVRNLSGGNQQKVVLAKWLFTDAQVLIFDEPTRGIDVGAKAEIYELMNDLAARGVAILMISSELEEVLGMADRVLVMHEGRIAGELPRAAATPEAVMHLATGAAAVAV
ncbi:MAG: sugar ABC transporter ATP-binding protein [Fimbriimonadaceae bacterium]|nr:sugar ABC transporter ATP-binding protein [Fimbriimonadaceae bacterium]